jgi:Spy/CpxP family protein refolding chaperone
MHLTKKQHKIMKATVIVILTAFSFTAFGQIKKDISGRHADKMKTELNLDDKQYQSIKSIDAKYAAKMEEKKALRQQHRDEINQVLTKEQQEKWQASQKERKQHRRSDHEHKRQFREDLNLNDQQKDQLKKINDEHHDMRKMIIEDKTLNEQQRKEKLQALNEQHRTQLQGILTPEQQEKMKSERNNRKEHRKEFHRHHKK